jgi:hypothetical protein
MDRNTISMVRLFVLPIFFLVSAHALGITETKKARWQEEFDGSILYYIGEGGVSGLRSEEELAARIGEFFTLRGAKGDSEAADLWKKNRGKFTFYLNKMRAILNQMGQKVSDHQIVCQPFNRRLEPMPRGYDQLVERRGNDIAASGYYTPGSPVNNHSKDSYQIEVEDFIRRLHIPNINGIVAVILSRQQESDTRAPTEVPTSESPVLYLVSSFEIANEMMTEYLASRKSECQEVVRDARYLVSIDRRVNPQTPDAVVVDLIDRLNIDHGDLPQFAKSETALAYLPAPSESMPKG